MSERISAELAATCGALGFYDGISYHLDTHCIDVIKDLIKYLKRDDDSHTVRQYLGQAKLLETDLKKIFVQHSDKNELWDVLLRLLINLTSPALLVYNETLPSEKTTRNMYEQLIVHLQSYKVALADDQVWSIVGKRLQTILNMDIIERGDENELVVERILTLIRNVLQVPASDNEMRADNDASLHDEVLFALHTSGLVDMLLFIASNEAEQQYHMQVLEIIALILREQCPRTLATAGLERSTIEKEKDVAKLLATREKESREKMDKIRKYAGSRHSRFGGTFVVENMKAIGDNQLICHKPYQKIEALQFGQDKVKVKKSKSRTPMANSDKARTSALSVRLFLKEFCVEFLNGAYNPVMSYARSCINGRNQGIAEDASYYLWTLRFFMEFNRHYKFQVKYVSETISTEIFHLVQRQLEQYYEMMIANKKQTLLWSKRLHLAIKAYQELLHTLIAMDSASDRGVRESSKIIKSNIFYVPEYRDTILSQLVYYDALKMSRSYLVDLVTTAHIFLKMLHQFCANRTVIVGKKARKRSQAASKKQKSGAKAAASSVPAPALDELWNDVAPEISAVMREGTIPEVVPFDATLETPIDEQKTDAIKRIQRLLRKKDFEEAVGLLRSARQVWPENDYFGKPDIPVEEEFLALREIFFAKLGADDEDITGQRDQEAEGDKNEEEMDDDEEEDERGEVAFEETNFNYEEFLRRFANVKIVKAITILLDHFEENSEPVNHYVVKMLHRIAWDCKMPGMMFQAAIFRIFQRILESKSSRHRELQKFAVFIIRRFAQVAEKNNKAFMELLFWKSTKEATEMVDGYDVAPTNEKVSRAMWTEAEEDELRTLFMEHQTKKYTQDLIDWILENIISDNRTRRGVIKKLKEMCLVVNSKTVRSEVQKRLPKEWSEEEVAELTEFWDRVREDRDPVEAIHEALTIKRPKNKIKEKLLEMGLAKDRKELRKKRGKKSDSSGGVKSSWEHQSESEASENSDDSEDDDSVPAKRNVKPVSKPTKRAKKPKKQPSVVYSDAQLLGLLKDVIEKDMREALEWVKESLEDVMEDRDEESNEGIPLVPLSEESEAAMDNPSFQRFLRAIGIEPPADEQESYWRVPATMLVATIRKRCQLIEDSLSGNFGSEDATLQPLENSQYDSSENSEGDDSDIEDNNDLTSVKKFFNSNSLDSNGAVFKSGAGNIIESTVNEEMNEENRQSEGKVTEDSADELKRSRSQDSESELPMVKKRRVIASDDDESSSENESPEKVVRKTVRRLVSDDEDDD